MSGGGKDISPTMNPHSNPFDFGRSLGYVSSSQRWESTDFLLWVAAFQRPDCSSNVRVCVLEYLDRGFVSLYDRWTWSNSNEQIDEEGGNSTIC